ncbi:MAG: DNA repair protein RadA [Chloroflexota bacterium]
MAKSPSRVSYVCQHCGWQSARWLGRCPDCGEWNSLTEVVDRKVSARVGHSSGAAGALATAERAEPVAVNKIPADRFARIHVPLLEFNRVLGGGIVPGSVVLIGGDPGIGKSTLLLQVSSVVAETSGAVLYVSGEESPQQIKMRANRLGIDAEALLILSETEVESVIETVQRLSPRLVVVDSIQTMYLEGLASAAGSVTQVRECAAALLRVAKATHIPMFVVGHVTKDGEIAGPRVLEHIVDAVLYLEGERFHSYRLLRGVKNRFGSTNEIGVFEMQNEGMVEVPNPSEVFLSERGAPSPGSTVVVTLEGTRPILVEVQALTTTTSFGLPRRTANGIDYSRLLLLTAVLTKRVGLALSNQDVYVNIVGGLRVNEPAVDLGVSLAIASSFRDQVVSPDLVAIGEVGLSGELRRVGHLDRRLAEAAKLGFKRCLLPASMRSARAGDSFGIEIVEVGSAREAIEVAFRV